MSKIDVGVITSDLRKKITNNKIEQENLFDFIAYELSKGSLEIDENVLYEMADLIDDKYNTKEEMKKFLQIRIDNFKQISLIRNDQLTNSQEFSVLDTENLIGNSRLFGNMKQLFNKLEKNKDLSDLRDGVFHFGKSHMGLAKRIFFLQVTQNYLAALKYLIINDVVTKQTLFNTSAEEALKSIIGMMSSLQKETTISIKELRNYKTESEKWIQNNEFRIIQLEEGLKKFDEISERVDKNNHIISNLEEGLKKFDEISRTIENNFSVLNNANHKLAIKTNENYNELKEMIITKDLKTTEFLLEKINKIERMVKEIDEKMQKNREK
ncbi:MAG: hypothetical protein WA799_02775 [Nitrosotalea sp.]